MGPSPRRAAAPEPRSQGPASWWDEAADWFPDETQDEPRGRRVAEDFDLDGPEQPIEVEDASDDTEPTPARSLGFLAEDETHDLDDTATDDLHDTGAHHLDDTGAHHLDDTTADDFGPDPVPARAWVDDEPEEDAVPARAWVEDDDADRAPAGEPEDTSVADVLPLPARPRRARLGFLVGGITIALASGSVLIPGAMSGIASAMPALTAEVLKSQQPASPAPVNDLDPARAPDRSTREAAVPRPALGNLSEISVVAGIPEPCSIDVRITDDLTAAEITERAERQWGFTLSGPQWRDEQYRPVVKLFTETVDAVDCTGYVDRVKAGNGGDLEISSLPTRSWAWGDYGLTRPKVLTLDFEKFRQGYADGDRGRLVRLVIHEMAHSLNADRFSEPDYWQAYNRVWSAEGPVSAYGSNATESFADAVGYYVARCAADNPYDSTEHAAYYDYVQTHIFDGRQFGGAVGTPQDCAIEGR
ncbi:hypothetical protein [Granulicoccus sp. GXG6511]|uniref:hypothetical protein n=1 Tax=Granulicoccus sp. GXG6511 TaxID=3381351 RepID=UPI003D7EF6B5